jgi:hypothetical protein
VNMQAVHSAQSAAAVWLGTIDARNLGVTAPYLNRPLRFPRARLEFAKSQKTLTLSAADAFGTMWHGTATRQNADAQWRFDLVADRLDAANLDRWLGPRARPGLIARLTGSSGAPTGDITDRDAAITRISARGRLRVSEIVLEPLHFEQFDGEAELAGRALSVRKVSAGFFGGKAAGTFDARLLAEPSYHFQGRFDRVNLALLGDTMPSLTERIAGTASGVLTLSAHGVGRENLVRSIEGGGQVDARNVELSDLDFARLIAGDNRDSPPGRFASAQGNFHVAGEGIEVSDFVFDNPQGRFQAEGRVDFSHALSLRIYPSIFHATTTLASAPPPSFLVGGTLESPSVVPPNSPVRAAAKSAARAR